MSEQYRQFSMEYAAHQSERKAQYEKELAAFFDNSMGTTLDKLNNFTKFVTKQSLCRFLAKNEIFQHIKHVHGHMIECGVFLGGGLSTWAHLSSIYDPYHYMQKVIGFDTFEGFADIADEDGDPSMLEFKKEGGLHCDSYEELQEFARLYQHTRPLPQFPNIELVKGDACQTIPQYVEDNKHLVVSLLYLDFDVYEPTKIAIEQIAPRMPKGAVIAFDELNQKEWPGETMAVLETLGLNNLEIRRTQFSSAISYAVL